MHEKRRFPRFPVTKRVVCFRYGREMIMRTLDISQGGMKLEANFDLGVDEPIEVGILIDGKRIDCKGRILETEEFGNKVQARLRFDRTSNMDFRKLSDFLRALSRRPFQRRVIDGSVLSRRGTTGHALTKGVKWVKNIFKGEQKDKKLEQVNSWLELLTDMEKRVIILRFGLNGEDTLTRETVGKRFGLSPERVCQIEAEAVEKLRKISQKKEVYLDDII